MRTLIKVAVATFGLIATIGPVTAGTPCGMRDKVIAKLQADYSEQLTAGGYQTSKSVMEVWTSTENGTFTVLLTNPNGVSCIVATGTGWFQAERIAEPAGIAG